MPEQTVAGARVDDSSPPESSADPPGYFPGFEQFLPRQAFRTADDSRVVNTQMWLVERRQDGSERSSPLTLRGAFNQPTPFYFEPVLYGFLEVQLYGSFTLTW